MVIGRANRRTARRERAAASGVAADEVEAALDLLELLELAWHDCYDEITPSEDVIDEVLLCGGGSLAGIAKAARLAVADVRDLHVWAAALRGGTDPPPAR